MEMNGPDSIRLGIDRKKRRPQRVSGGGEVATRQESYIKESAHKSAIKITYLCPIVKIEWARWGARGDT